MRIPRLIPVITLALATAVALSGQGQRGGDTGNSGNTGSSGNTGGGRGGSGQTQNQGGYNNNTQQNDPFGRQQNDPFGNRNRPLYLNGKVVTDDGLPPTEPVVVQRVCVGNTYPEGYTDSKGRFSFQVGGDLSMLTSDASVSGGRISQSGMLSGGSYTSDGIREIGLGRFDLSACVLRAELSGYRSNDVQLGMYSTMENNDVGVIVLTRLDGLVGNVVSALTLKAPKPAQKAYQNGLREMRKKKPNYKKAVTQYTKAVGEYPEFAAAWAAMGDAKLAMEDAAGAKEAYSKAIGADPKYLRPYEPLIKMAVEQADWMGLEAWGSSYLELNPNAGNVRFLTAVAALNTGKPEKAEEMVLAMQAREDSSKFPQSYQIMGMIHEQRAEFEKAAGQYRSFIGATNEPDSQNVLSVKRKLHEWQMLGVIQASE
ncbi:MAG: tetratricopeptide repeat protein [Bryobacterales bacterium]|nr:tetratricopeptide repeat protein [Bryobacterales bacterium]